MRGNVEVSFSNKTLEMTQNLFFFGNHPKPNSLASIRASFIFYIKEGRERSVHLLIISSKLAKPNKALIPTCFAFKCIVYFQMLHI